MAISMIYSAGAEREFASCNQVSGEKVKTLTVKGLPDGAFIEIEMNNGGDEWFPMFKGDTQVVIHLDGAYGFKPGNYRIRGILSDGVDPNTVSMRLS